MRDRERWGLALAIALSLAVRLGHLAAVAPLPVVSDASGYDAAARRLIATGTLAFPVGADLWRNDAFREDAWGLFLDRPSNAWTMPGYPFLVAGLYRLFGTGPGRFHAVRVVQALLGTVLVALGFWIARRTFGADAGWVALGLGALYPPALWTPEYLMTETLFAALFMTQVALILRAERRGRRTDYALLAIASAGATWVRPVGAVIPAILLVLEGHRILRSREPRAALAGGIARFAVFGAVLALLLAPWVVRNARLYRAFVPATSAADFPAIQGDMRMRGLAAPLATSAQFAQLQLTGFDDHRYARQVTALLRGYLPPATLADLVKLQIARARMLGEALTTPFTFAGAPVPGLTPGSALQSALLALGVIGLWSLRRSWRSLALFAGVLAGYGLPYWLVSNLWSRYLYPVMPLLLVLAAGGTVQIARWVSRTTADRGSLPGSPEEART